MIRSALPRPTPLLSAACLAAALVLPATAAQDEAGSGSGDEVAPGIEWLDDLVAAHLDADEHGRPILLYVRSTTCDKCDDMLEHTFTDERVVEAASGFTWVLMDKDKQRNELADFHVLGTPSVLVLGPKDENVYRFEGFKPPTVFLAELHRAQGRYELFMKGEAWDPRPPRPASLLTGRKLESVPLPINEPVHGVAFVEGKLFVVQQRNLFGLDAETLEWKTSFPLPQAQIRDICTDGKLIYVLPWGWSKGDPIYALDPATGSTVMKIGTKRNEKQKHYSAQGIEWFKGELYVLADRDRIYVIDPVTGDIRISLKIDVPTYGLAYDGESFVTVNQRGVHFLTPSGQLERSVATNYPLGAIGFHDGTYYLGESEIRDHDREHRFSRVWPETFVLHEATLR